jgi:hypothetical protein
MPIQQKVFSILVSVGIMVVIVELVRRRRLREEYSWLWLLTGAVLLLCVVTYTPLVFLSRLIGAVLPTTTLFLGAIVFLLLLNLQFSTRISRMSDQIKDLAQENALLRADVERRSGGGPGVTGG